MSLAISSCLLAVGIAQADTTYIRDRPCAGCQVVLDTVNAAPAVVVKAKKVMPKKGKKKKKKKE